MSTFLFDRNVGGRARLTMLSLPKMSQVSDVGDGGWLRGWREETRCGGEGATVVGVPQTEPTKLEACRAFFP